jgi:hypothetical protein
MDHEPYPFGPLAGRVAARHADFRTGRAPQASGTEAETQGNRGRARAAAACRPPAPTVHRPSREEPHVRRLAAAAQ